MRLRRLRPFALVLLPFLFLPCGRRAAAEIVVDPVPPLTWDEMLACELVVAAHYSGHEDGFLTLAVDDVLQGVTVKSGDVLRVGLEHWYSIQTGAVYPGHDPADGANGVPKLCYRTVLWGGTMPSRAVADVRNSAVYFFRRAETPSLRARGQVQPALLADGWQAAIGRKAPSLLFRLVQDVHPALAREALEELRRDRDAGTMGRLVGWVTAPPALVPVLRPNPAEAILAAVGDRDGDVYAPLLRVAGGPPAGANGQGNALAARLLARAAPARAVADFRRLIDAGAPARAQMAGALGFVHDDAAVALALRLLEDAALAETAAHVLNHLLDPGNHATGAADAATRQRWMTTALPRIRAAVESPAVPEAAKRQLRGGFFRELRTPVPFDADRARKILLNPDDPLYKVPRHVGEAERLLEDLRSESEPRAVPLLVDALVAFPEAAKGHPFLEVLKHFAIVCGNRLREELETRGLVAPFDPAAGDDRSGSAVATLRPLLRAPGGMDDVLEIFRTPGGRAWIAGQRDVRNALVAAQRTALERGLGGAAWRPSIMALHVLAEFDAAGARAYVDRFVDKGVDAGAYDVSAFLGAAVRAGRLDLRARLIASVRNDVVRGGRDGPWWNATSALLDSGDAEAFDEYLRLTDAMPRRSSHENRERPDDFYVEQVRQLFPRHAGAYFERVGGLLESESLAERQGAARLLAQTLAWDFRFDPAAFAAERAARMEAVRPLLKALAGLTETQMRGRVLEELGVTLDGPAGPGWVPRLQEAAGNPDPAVARNALKLLEDVTGEYGCTALQDLPAPARGRAVAAWLEDRGVAGRRQ